MKSGLEGRNNNRRTVRRALGADVSMKSGLEGRNNALGDTSGGGQDPVVSMKSGLEGRNNAPIPAPDTHESNPVSMKSGLEGRNNLHGQPRLRRQQDPTSQ